MPISYSLSNEVEHGLRSCGSTLGCFEALALSFTALLVWAGFSAGFLFVPTNIRGAVTALRRECDAIAAERRALASFADRVEELPTSQLWGQSAGGGVVTTPTQPTGKGMAAVEAAYRETVMAVDHYEADYGEPFGEHLASEFGEEVAGAVLANERLSPQVQNVLLSEAHEACLKREQYVDALSAERDRLEAAGETFETVSERCDDADGQRLRRRSFEELRDRLERVSTERERLSEAVLARQEQIHEGVTFGWYRQDAESVYSYLYEELDVTYPVLADGSDLLERLRHIESRLITALTAKT